MSREEFEAWLKTHPVPEGAIVCRNQDGDVMGMVAYVGDNRTPEQRRAEHQAWIEERYPGPTIGKDSEFVRALAAAKAAR